VLVIDGQSIAESMAILEYLEDTRKEKPLLPKDPSKRAIVRQLCEIINTGVQPLSGPSVLGMVPEEKRTEFASKWITTGLKGNCFTL
jgi:maleylacetoacetate isomerase